MDRLNPSRYKDSYLVQETGDYSIFRATRVFDEEKVSVWCLPINPENAANVVDKLNQYQSMMVTKHPSLLECYNATYMPAKECILIELELGCYETFTDLILRLKDASIKVSEDAIWEVVAQLSQAIAYCYNPLNRFDHTTWHFLHPREILRMESGRTKLFHPAAMHTLMSNVNDSLFQFFMAPECVSLPETRPTQAAAVWFVGRLAWVLANPQVLTSPSSPWDPSHLNNLSYSSDLTSLIDMCLSKDPSARPTASELTTFSLVVKAESRLLVHASPMELSLTQPISIPGLFDAISENSVEGLNRHKVILSQEYVQQETIEKAVSLCITLKNSKLLSILCDCIAKINIRVRLKDFAVDTSTLRNTIMSPRNSFFVEPRDSVSTFSLAEKTSLMNAAIVGNTEQVQEFLYEAGKQNTYGKTALMMAAEGGHSNCVRLLLIEAGYVDLENKSALYYAYVGFNAPLYSFSNRESLSDRDSFHSTLQHTSAISSMMPSLTNPFAQESGSITGRNSVSITREDRETCISLLYSHEKDIVADDGTTLLMLLAEANCKEGVAALKDLQGMRDSFGRTALTRGLACGANYDTLLPLLSNEHELPYPEETALTYAIREGFLEGTRQLISSMANISNRNNLMPIEVARKYGRLECEELLLAFEWNTTSALKSEHLQSLVNRQIYALKNLNKDIVEKLDKIIHTYWPKFQISQAFCGFEFPLHYVEIAHLCPEALDSHLNEALNLALNDRQFEVLTHLCERIATKRTRVTLKWHDSNEVLKATPLINAALNDNETEIRLLLKHELSLGRSRLQSSAIGAFPDNVLTDDAKLLQPISPQSPRTPRTPPSLLCESSWEPMLSKSHNGITALGAAASIGSLRCLRLLLGELGTLPKKGMSALMCAARYGHKNCVRLLLSEAGQTNHEGDTALILAAKYGHASCVELLKPFEYRIKDRRGRTALQWAIEKPYKGAVTWGASDSNYEACISILSTDSRVCH